MPATTMFNAQWFSGSSKEAQIRAAIVAAAADGAPYVYVPLTMQKWFRFSVQFEAVG